MTNEIATTVAAPAGFFMRMWEFIRVDILKPIFDNLITMNQDLIKGVFLALIILFVGWVIGKIVEWITKLILKLIRFDNICDKVGITRIFENGGIHNIPSNAVAMLLYWIVLLITFVSAIDRVLAVSSFQNITILVTFIPKAFLALLILIIGLALGYFFSKLIKAFIINTGVGTSISVFLEKAFFVAFAIFTFIQAISKLGVPDKFVSAVINSALTYGFIGIAIAFGLGTRNFAEDFLSYFKIKSAFPKGSEILVDGEKAIVKEIRIFHTMLYTEKGIMDLPNATLSRKIVKKVV